MAAREVLGGATAHKAPGGRDERESSVRTRPRDSAAENVASVDARGGRGRTDSGRGRVAVCEAAGGRRGEWKEGGRSEARLRRRGHGMAAEDIASADVAELWGEEAEDHRHRQGHRSTVVVPAWTWRHAWDAAMTWPRGLCGGCRCGRDSGELEEESGAAAADKATKRPR